MCISTEFGTGKEEQTLFQEVAGDIAFALYSLELEEERNRIEKALQEAEFRYRTTLDSMKDAIHAVDTDLRFVLFNSTFKEWNKKIGLKTDVIGRPLFEIFPFLPESVKDEYKKVFDTGKVLITEETSKVDNREFITETQKIPVFEGEKVILVVTVIRDITRQKRREKVQSTLYNITKAVNVASDLKELFVSIREYLNEIIDTTNFVIGLYDNKRDELSVTYKVDEKDKYTSFPLGKTLTAYVIRTGKPLLATEKVMNELTRAGKVKMIGTPSKIWLGVPLKIGESVVGVITVQSYEDASHYTKEDLELLEFVSAQIVSTIKRKQAEEALKNSEQEKCTILDSLVEHVIHEDRNMKILWANRAAYESAGLTREELIGRYCYEIWPKRNEPCPDCPVIKAMETGQPQEGEKTTPDGKIWLLRGYPERDENGRIVGGIEITLEITQRRLAQQARKRAEEQIQNDLKEKEILLKEIHHRVKNNLQVVSSLLSLQSDYVRDKEALQMFKESRDRVKSMALVHEKLYRSKDLARINFEEYIRSLVQNLYRAYGADPSRIELHLDVKNIHLGMDFAIPCGLIINELVSNALKYAFPPSWEREKKIWISFHKIKSNEIELIVQDSGVGIPENLDIRNSGSLGMRLVSILAEDQLHAKINIERKQGTKFQIKFEV